MSFTTDALLSLSGPTLDHLFWQAERLGTDSAWWRHVLFAHRVICATTLRAFVELAARTGVSNTAFCQAVARKRLDTRCHAMGTWRGDRHKGEFGDEVFEDFYRFHDERYGVISTLLCCTIYEALEQIDHASVDCLHIDRLRTYEGVRHDFESWAPMLSDNAAVRFHGTSEYSADLGVWRRCAELHGCDQGFEFLHGYSFGLLAGRNNVPPMFAALCALNDASAIALVRERCAQVGERWLWDTRERRRGQESGQRAAIASTEAAALRGRATRAEAEAASLRGRVERAETEAANAVAQMIAMKAEATCSAQIQEQLRAQLANRTVVAGVDLERARSRAERARVGMARSRSDLARTASKRDVILASPSWRLTSPLRAVGKMMLKEPRRVLRDGGKLIWWTLTLKLPRKLRKRRQRRLFDKASRREAAALRLRMGATAWPIMGAVSPQLGHDRTDATMQPAGSPVATLRLAYISGEPDTPGHFYRVARSATAAAALGAQTTWMRVAEIPARLVEIETADILLIWRAPWDELVAAAVAAARQSGAKIVFDVDDLMVDPNLARTDVIDGIRSQNLSEEGVIGHFKRVRATMAVADLCVAPTEELAARMRRAWMPAMVLRNGFDEVTLAISRLAARRRHAAGPGDGLVRIGYASGSRTHQRDFAQCAEAVASVLRARANCRLVAFRSPVDDLPVVDIEEYPVLRGLEHQIEWRNLVPLAQLPTEIARFDINLAPLELGNPFCEAKSELKFFEAALVDVVTIASPTGPFQRAIRQGDSGLLAASPKEWAEMLLRLVDDAILRRRLAATARRDVLWRYGPERRMEDLATLIDLVRGGRDAARIFELQLMRCQMTPPTAPHIPDHRIIFEADQLGFAEGTIAIPLYNYANYVVEALESAKAQKLEKLDLIVIDDCSTDDSLAVALSWTRENAGRFNRVVVLRNDVNSGLAFTRNVGFDVADTPFILPLDADNRLLPDCLTACLQRARATSVSFVYPLIRKFGSADGEMGETEYSPVRLANGNYIDAMALVSKAAWTAVGGYDHVPGGWEDFDFWCRLAERGFRGERVPGGPLAEYRVHEKSMIQAAKSRPDTIRSMMADLGRRHPWLDLTWPLPEPSQRDLPSTTLASRRSHSPESLYHPNHP